MDTRSAAEKVLVAEKEKLALEDHYSMFSVALLYFWPLHVPVNCFFFK